MSRITGQVIANTPASIALAAGASADIDWFTYDSAVVTLSGSAGTYTLTFSKIKAGQRLTVYVTNSNDAIIAALTWPASVKAIGSLTLPAIGLTRRYELHALSDSVVTLADLGSLTL